MNGLLLVDKPAGITSHDVVDHLRRATRQRRIGHTGTLDPRATGLLVLCLGQATRLSELLTGLDKAYEGRMRLGVTTNSYDMDGPIIMERPVPEELDIALLQNTCNQFVGDIMQMPPMMSAVKVGGKRLYKLARKGETIEREARPVSVYAFDVLCWEPPYAGLRVRCGSGTYVRSLCHEAGELLGCGAALDSLRRTAVGRFSVEQATPLAELADAEAVRQRLIPMDDALDLPAVTADVAQEAMITTGSTISISVPLPGLEDAGIVQIKSAEGRLLALGVAHPTAMGYRIQPKRVFTGYD